MIWLLACTAGPAPKDGNDSAAPPAATGALTDETNYQYTLDLAIEPISFSPADEGRLDWRALTRDLQGFPVDPAADVSVLDLVWFRELTHAQVQEAIVTGTLVQASVGLLARGVPAPGSTSFPLDALDVYGTPFVPTQYFPEPGGSWLLRVATTTNSSAMLAFLVPSEGDRDIYLHNESATLDFAANLHDLEPVQMGGTTTVTWDTLTRDGRGAPIDPLLLQELSLARYDARTPEELEARFFELEALADATWTLNVYDEDGADLADAVDAAGTPFPGFGDADAAWVLALRCVLCTSPAPSYLTLIDPRG